MPGEERPGQRAADDERDPLRAVGVLGDREPAAQARRLDDSATIDNVVCRCDVEGFTDVGEEYAECRPVEFVDRVQPEQDEQRECGLAAADAAQPVHRVGHPVAEPPPHRRVVDRGERLSVGLCGGRGCHVAPLSDGDVGRSRRARSRVRRRSRTHRRSGSQPPDAGRRNLSGRRRYGRGPSRRRTRAVRRYAGSRPRM